MSRNCLLKHAIEGNIDRRKVTRRRRRRRKQLLDDVRERRGYCKLKEEVLDSTAWRIGFGSGCGPVERQTDRLRIELKLASV